MVEFHDEDGDGDDDDDDDHDDDDDDGDDDLCVWYNIIVIIYIYIYMIYTLVIDRHTCTAFKIVESENIYFFRTPYRNKKQDELT